MEAGGPLGQQTRHPNLGWGEGGRGVGGPWADPRATQKVESRTWQRVREAKPDSTVPGEERGAGLPPTYSRYHSGCGEGEKYPGKCLHEVVASGGDWAVGGGEAGTAIYL